VAYAETSTGEGDQHPDLPIEVIDSFYEGKVRGLHPATLVGERNWRGRIGGFIEKIRPERVGITPSSLLTVMEFDQFEAPFRDPVTGERLSNAWAKNGRVSRHRVARQLLRPARRPVAESR